MPNRQPEVLRFADIGRRLKRERQRQEIEVEVLARRTGVSAKTITHIESGNADQYLSYCIALAVALELPFKELFAGQYNSADLTDAVEMVLANDNNWTVN